MGLCEFQVSQGYKAKPSTPLYTHTHTCMCTHACMCTHTHLGSALSDSTVEVNSELNNFKSKAWQWSSEMAQQEFAAKPDDWNSLPGTHMVEGERPPPKAVV